MSFITRTGNVKNLALLETGSFFHHRTWCMFCTMGTLASAITLVRRKIL